jgi:3D (Asp-Asp-Asp) domain-containing protein
MRTVLATVALLAVAAIAQADDSKLAKEDVRIERKATMRGKNKLCCGYPISDDQGFKLTFYWLTQESEFQEVKGVPTPQSGLCAIPASKRIDIYSSLGFFIGRVQEKFACNLALEGSGLMMDGRVLNYAGPCRYGTGTCFEQLDVNEHPFGRGAGVRPLIPFKSVAIDLRVFAIGEPLYIPEFDGLLLPNGSFHDGCVRAEDTGGMIRKHHMDFFVVTAENYKFLLDQMLGFSRITPHIEAPRCEYLRDL